LKSDDIWYSELKDGKWQNAKNINKPLNNVGYNFILSVSPDENTMLVANEYLSDGSPGASGVSITHRTATGWEIPQKIEIEDFYNLAKFASFCLSADGKKIFMSIERKNSYGEHDIYLSFLQKSGKWSVPKNLGPVVNTKGDEVSPFLASDNVTLYYSTNGHPGYGSNDIFITRRLDKSWTKWSKPQNIGSEVNGVGFDAYYTIPASGEYAYFVSDEPSLGLDDIFKIKLKEREKPEPVVIIYGKVLDKQTNLPIDAEITYYDLNTNEEIGIARSNPKDGTFKIILPYGKAYGFHAHKRGFYPESDNLDLTQVKEFREVEKDLLLAPIEVGKNIILKNVFFVRSKAVLLPGSNPELDRLVKIMLENPGLNIEISGHTDNVGIPELNQKLSEDRVAMIIKYLVKKGVSAKRLTGKGYGDTKPVASNASEETRRLNRRVEFTILNK
jgi:outer membrane protein OmpA-like peptidoglycan-associated protein